MPAWDRDHPQDVGSGLQSPATAERDGLRRKNNSPLLTCRQWETEAEARTQTHTGWMVLHSAPMCMCECKEKHHWNYCYNHGGAHLHSTPMCSWGEGTYSQHWQEKPITPGKKILLKHISLYITHTHKQCKHKSSRSKTIPESFISSEHHSKRHIIAFL